MGEGMIKRILTVRIYIVIAPPSLCLTRFMTLKECQEFVNKMISYGNNSHIIVRDISGKFIRNYPKVYPINGLILKS